MTFLDVGCYEGDICIEAVRRGAAKVVGIDYCTCPDLQANLSKAQFDFIQLDILSEKALQLPEFDIVHAAGVLYHVENPISFLFRLRKLVKLGGIVIIETSACVDATQHPIMVFHHGASFDDNPSNWWSPNEACLTAMLQEVGFCDLQEVHRAMPPASADTVGFGRLTIRGRATSTPHAISQKMLPRRPAFMPQAPGHGNRAGVPRSI